jgi:hypothetical protein
MRRLTVADKRCPLQMRRCISAACERLNFARTDADSLIILFGGSDGFFHFVVFFDNNIPKSGYMNAILCFSLKELRCALPAISALFFYLFLLWH